MNRNDTMLVVTAGTLAGYLAYQTLRKKPINTLPYGYGIKLKETVFIDRPPAELYRHWRNLETLTLLAPELQRIDVADATHSTWLLTLPGGLHRTWKAEITVDRENEMIGWRSLPGSGIDSAGYVRFEPVGSGTLVKVALQYNPPGGKLGAALAAALGERPEDLVTEALQRFKHMMETGKIPQRETRKRSRTVPFAARKNRGRVETASEQSFPASDPPSWTGAGV